MELGRHTGLPWLKTTPTEPPGFSLTVFFSYNLNLMLFIFTCQCQTRVQILKMSWFSSKGQTCLERCKIVFLLPVGYTMISFEICYLLPNLFICLFCFVAVLILHFILLNFFVIFCFAFVTNMPKHLTLSDYGVPFYFCPPLSL